MFLGRPECKPTHINIRPAVYTHRFPHMSHTVNKLLQCRSGPHTHIWRHKNKHKDPEIKQNKAHLAPELFSKAGGDVTLIIEKQDIRAKRVRVLDKL